MRRLAQVLLIGFILSLPAVAQRGGGFHGGGGMGGGFHGGGGMGGGFHGGMNGGFRGGMGGHGGGFRGGFVGPGFRGGFHPGFGPRNRFIFGFGYSGYWPYYYGPGWGYPYDAYPSYPYAGYSYPYNDSTGYVESAPSQVYCPQVNGQALVQIKLVYQDNVWVVQNYWYTADTLNFVTPHGEQNKTPISSIDRSVTFELNRACGINFQLP